MDKLITNRTMSVRHGRAVRQKWSDISRGSVEEIKINSRNLMGIEYERNQENQKQPQRD